MMMQKSAVKSAIAAGFCFGEQNSYVMGIANYYYKSTGYVKLSTDNDNHSHLQVVLRRVPLPKRISADIGLYIAIPIVGINLIIMFYCIEGHRLRKRNYRKKPNEVGKRLTQIRKLRKLSRSDLSESTGISVNHLSWIENYQYANPTMNMLKELSMALNVSIDYLVFGDNSAIITQDRLAILPKREQRLLKDVISTIFKTK